MDTGGKKNAPVETVPANIVLFCTNSIYINNTNICTNNTNSIL